MIDENSLFPKIATGFAIEPHLNDIYLEAFSIRTFNQHGNERENSIKELYNHPQLIFRHLPIKEKVKYIKVKRMRHGYIVDALTFLDIQEIIKMGGKVVEIYEAVIYRESFKVSPL